MVSARTVGSFLIELSSESNETDLTNLKLQKMLFYAQAEHLARHGEPLFVDAIEAWRYGPVVSSVYAWLRGCGAYPITSFDVETDSSDLTEEQKEFLTGIAETYGKYSAPYLVRKTHEDPAWSSAWNPQRNNVIDLRALASVSRVDEW